MNKISMALTFIFLMANLANASELGRGQKFVRTHPFTIYAYIEFPVDINKYKEAGFTSIIAAINEESSESEINTFSPIRDAGLEWHYFRNINYSGGITPEKLNEQMKKMLEKYPNNAGWNIGDEDEPNLFLKLKILHDKAREIAPDAMVYSAIRGMDFPPSSGVPYDSNSYSEYVDKVIRDVQPDILMYDQYPFYGSGTAISFYENLGIVREKALEANLPYWCWLQSHGWTKGPFREPSESELRIQAFSAMAYGYTGFGYWTFASTYEPYSFALLDSNGNRTHIFESIKKLLPELKTLGESTRFLRSTGVYYEPARVFKDGQWLCNLPRGTARITRQDEPRIRTIRVSDGMHGFIVGLFKDDNDQSYLMLVNTNHASTKTSSDTVGAISIQFDYSVSTLEKLNRATGEVETVNLCNHELNHYVIPGGTGELFKFSGSKKFAGSESRKIKKILCIGNSITCHGPSAEKLGWQGSWGMAATSEANDYAHTLYRYIQDSQSELKPELRIASMLATNISGYEKLCEYNADVVVVQMGDNMLEDQATSENMFKPYQALIRALKKNSNPIVICTSLWDGNSQKRNAFIKEACEKEGALFVDITAVGMDPANQAGAEGNFTNPGVNWHPGDKGMKMIADAIWKDLKNKLDSE